MPSATIDKLIINSPYQEPTKHWRYDRQKRLFDLVDGRRSAGYVVASGDSKAFDDPGVFKGIPLVNQIRPRVKDWRNAGYPGVTGIPDFDGFDFSRYKTTVSVLSGRFFFGLPV